MRAKEIRARSKKALRGKWDVAVVTTLVAVMLGVLNDVRWDVTYKLGSEDLHLQDYIYYLRTPEGQKLLTILALITSVTAVWSLACFFIGGTLQLGYCQFALNLRDGEEAKFSQLFGKFDMFAKGFMMRLLISLYTLLWTLLLVIPGIIKSYSYAMTPYILTEHPELSANEAITASRKLMRGNKWRLFCLELSFIGWHILASLSFGIGYLWLNPYIQTAKAEFYRQICAERN